MLDFLIYLVYTKSGSVSSEQLKYWVLFDFLADKGQVNAGLLGTSTESRKRPESSSPEKLKARNKEKFKDIQAQDKKKYSDHDEEEEEQYEKEEFEKMLDKGDDEDEGDEDEVEGVRMQESKKSKPRRESPQQEEEEGVIDEEEMLDIAEKCFIRIAEAIIDKGCTVREAFKKYIVKEMGPGEEEGQPPEELELISPIGFLEGVKGLGIGDLEEIDVACLMRILTKPDIENAILLQELIIIMENFGIHDNNQMRTEEEVELQETPGRATSKTGGGKRKVEGIDLSTLDEKSIKILAKLMLALMELNVSLHEFFDGVIFEQLVKAKAGKNGNSARKVEIINSKDFFEYLQARGVRKNPKAHPQLRKILQLDPNYPELILVKKLSKAIEEIAKNEELMEGIMAAAEDGAADDDGGRLVTIGEEDNTGTQNTHNLRAAAQHEVYQDDEEEDEYI